jgi:hypothetical protein
MQVLSVVAQQVLTIQRAKAAGKKRFVFEGVELPLVHTVRLGQCEVMFMDARVNRQSSFKGYLCCFWRDFL